MLQSKNINNIKRTMKININFIKKFKTFGLIIVIAFVIILSFMFFSGDNSDKIGNASTKFNLLGKNDRIEIEAFDDPDVSGISCYLSYAKKGGLSETVNMEVDVSNFSLSCIKTKDKIEFNKEVALRRKKTEVYKRRASIAFKTMQVERYYDEKRNVFVYMAYSDKILDGSPNNSVSVVHID